MKKITSFFAGLLFILVSFTANAQSKAPADYFSGKWTVGVEGTPNGDSKMTMNLTRKDGTLGGIIITKEGEAPITISKVEETEKSVTVYFTTNGYDVYLALEKKDEDRVMGTLMGMFSAKGDRVKETTTKK